MTRRTVDFSPLSAVALVLVCSNCDYTAYATEVGVHVVYHWDAEAREAEGERLCGGTVEAADRFVAAIADYYKWPVPNGGPTIEYFWDRGLARSVCSQLNVSTCAIPAVAGSVVLAHQPSETHELAHTAQGGHGHAGFINEGFASRWESGMLAGGFSFRSAANFFDEAELRAQLELDSSKDVDYQRAFTWWLALERSYGPAKMAAFIAALQGPSSANAVERALQRVFGLSLAESAALAQRLPAQYVEDPVCELDGLPTLVWTEHEPLVIDRGDARCSDGDLVTMIGGQRATWLVAIEFPTESMQVDVQVRVSAGENPRRKQLVLARCHDGRSAHEWAAYDMFNPWPPDEPGVTRRVDGRYVAGLRGVITAAGAVEFPRVTFVESQS